MMCCDTHLSTLFPPKRGHDCIKIPAVKTKQDWIIYYPDNISGFTSHFNTRVYTRGVTGLHSRCCIPVEMGHFHKMLETDPTDLISITVS